MTHLDEIGLQPLALRQGRQEAVHVVEIGEAQIGVPPHDLEPAAGVDRVVAEQAAAQPRGPAGPSLSDVLGSSASLPEATPTKKGGSTFDTLNGNVLTR